MDEILIVGLGSVGRRHLANLWALGWQDIRLCRTGLATLPDTALASFPVEHDLERALARRPLAVIVANPSALHVPVALAAARAGAHLLIEKPLSHDLNGIHELERIVAVEGLAALVGFQFRFNPGLQRLKAWIDEGVVGQVVSARVHWGEYLPTMHPWEDYRKGYAARRDLGGGVLLTFCHVFDYLRWLLGEIQDVVAIETHNDWLHVDVETCVDVALRFQSGAAAAVHLDFVQQPHTHDLSIIGTEGTLTWSHTDSVARHYRAETREWHAEGPSPGFDRNDMFVDELRHFIACLRGEEQPRCTLRDGREVVRVVETAKHSMQEVLA